MKPAIRTLVVLLGTMHTGNGAVSGQGTANPACALLSVDEVRQITAEPAYTGPSPGENDTGQAGGTASCQYGGRSATGGKSTARISVTLIPKGIKAAEAQRKQPLRAGCTREDVKDLGDDGLYEACEAGPGAVVVTRKGASDVLVQIQVKPGTDPAAKATVIALARAALAKVR